MTPDKKETPMYSISYKLPRDQISTFLTQLEEMREDYLEYAVSSKENQGFPEANEVIANIKGML
jgi:hypothetical protein